MNNNKQQTNVILYCRVSTDEQAEKGFSLNYQEESLKRYCDRMGYNVVKIYREDHSAKNFKRPQWSQLKAYTKSNKKTVDKVLFTKWDRYSRNVEQALTMLREFDAIGIELNSSEQNLDMTNCDNKMVLAIYLTAGEVERDKISSRSILGTYQAKCEGYYACRAPFGYSSQRGGKAAERGLSKGKRTKLVPNENAHYVTEAYRAVATGLEPAEIVRRRLSKKGMKLEKSSFNLMLKNIVYAGKIEVPEYKKEAPMLIDGVHEPLIDLDTFLKVQDIFKNKRWKGLKTGQKIEDFVLREFLICECCGRQITGSYSKGRTKKYGYYHCRGNCKTRVAKETAENNVASLLSNLQINPNVKELFIEVLKDSEAQVNEDKTTELKKKIERKNTLEEQLNSADDMLLTGKLNTERYNSIVDRYSAELRALNLEIEALKSNDDSLFEFIDASVELLSNLDKLFIESGYDGKKIIAGSIFSDKLIFGNECCRTTKINEVIEVLNRNSKGLEGLKKGKAVKKDSLSVKVPGAGVEPARFPTGV